LLNTPRRPQEASGTSGQKSPINGGVNVSIPDGWWAEGYEPSLGWAIGAPHDYADAEAQDRDDVESIYRLLADEVVPMYYARGEGGYAAEWVAWMKRSIARLAPRFSSARMVRDYALSAYLPAMRAVDGSVDEARLWAP